jgi:hypothetical protein
LRLVNWAVMRRLFCRCCSTAAHIPCSCCKKLQPGTSAGPGGRCAPLSSLHVLTLPWHPSAAGWCTSCGMKAAADKCDASLCHHAQVHPLV